MANKFRKSLACCAAAALAAGWLHPIAPLHAQSRQTARQPAQQHLLAIQVDQNDKSVMDLALNNASNVVEHYQAKGENVTVEIVTFGPGLHMLRADTSPVKDRIAALSLQHGNIRFAACGNTQANMSKAEGKAIALVSEAKVTPSGVVRLMELQQRGYAYIRP
jgi:intracellular sulfur oxidation DsrE/DsrF family protein